MSAIEDALAAAGVSVPDASESPTIPDRERTQHVWLQYADGPNWVDLDPSFPGAEAGTAYATVSETVDQLPDELFHTVDIRVMAEVVVGGAPTPTEVLSHRVRSADVAGLVLMLVHPNAEWLGVAEAITGQQKHVPTLFIGDIESIRGTAISLSEGEGVLGALGEEAPAEGQALAEWVEYDVISPDRPMRQARRGIFDRISVEDRMSGAIDLTALPPIEQIDGGEQLGTFYTPLAGATMISVAGLAMPWQYFPSDPTATDEVTMSAAIAHSFHALRDVVRLDQLAELPGRFFADEPNVAAVSVGSLGLDDSGNANVTADMDIIHAHHALASFPTRTAGAHPGILAGAIDHAAERIVFEDSFKIGAAAAAETSFVSVGLVFETARDAGVKIVALLPAGDAPMPDVEPVAAALITQALEAGRIVVVPETSVSIDGAPRSGWWEIDPTTGDTVDRLDNGRGSVLVEFAELLHWLFFAGVCFFSIGVVIGGVVSGATGNAMAGAAVGAGFCIAAAATGPAVLAPFI